MRHELVHRLTHVGLRLPASLPDRGHLGRAGALARTALNVAALVLLLAALPMAVAVAVTALLIDPLAGWFAVLATVAVGPALARRLAVDSPASA
ncbi:MAG: hypothetical protein ABEH59_09935 [Halobacteriales archaeon]